MYIIETFICFYLLAAFPRTKSRGTSWETAGKKKISNYIRGMHRELLCKSSQRSLGMQHAIWSDGQLRLNRTARIPRTYVSRTALPHILTGRCTSDPLLQRLTSLPVRRNAQRPGFNRDPLLIAHASRPEARVGCTYFFEIKAELARAHA